MSINNLFSDNDFIINCGQLNCENIVDNKAIYRLNIDPTSNPDPLSGGLIVTAASTAAFNFVIPLSDNQTFLGLADTIKYDPENHLSFNGTTITCNKAGNYNITIQLGVLSNLLTPNNVMVSQILRPADSMFSSPPGGSAATAFVPLPGTPITPIYNIGAFTSTSVNVHMNIGEQFNIKFYLAYDTCVIALTSCIGIVEL